MGDVATYWKNVRAMNGRTDVSDAVYRLWYTCYSLARESGTDSLTVEVADDELATLMHRSARTIQRVRERAYDCGVLIDQGRVTESAPGRQPVTRRRLTVVLPASE